MMTESMEIKRRTASDEAFRALHDMIISGRLKPGDKLPSQDKLAVQFAVSRNTVREAINKLTVIGLLTAKQGIGTVVNISGPSSYMTSLSDHLLMQPATIRDFLESRVVIERAAVRLAILRATEEDIAAIKANVNDQKDALRRGKVQLFIDLDVSFHIMLARASGNQVLWKFLETVTDLLSRFVKEVSLLPHAMEHAYAFHKKILDYMLDKDTAGAQEEVLAHLYDVAQNIEKSTGIEIVADFPYDINGRTPKNF